MKEKILSKLKKKMESGAKAIAIGDKAIQAIKDTQAKVITDFNAEVAATVKKSESEIAYHQDIIRQAGVMTL